MIRLHVNTDRTNYTAIYRQTRISSGLELFYFSSFDDRDNLILFMDRFCVHKEKFGGVEAAEHSRQ
jgi:hypothetical protein